MINKLILLFLLTAAYLFIFSITGKNPLEGLIQVNNPQINIGAEENKQINLGI